MLQKIGEKQRHAVKEVTLDLSDSMRKIVRTTFPKADRVIDRFHIQKLACDAVQELRVKHRWAAIQQANDEQEEAKLAGESYDLSAIRMVIPARNCLSVPVTCYSSLPTNGLKDKNNGLPSSFPNIPI